MNDEQFRADHAPGTLAITASGVPSLVLPREHLAEHSPSPLAYALHLRGDVPLEARDPDPLAVGLLELGHMDEAIGDRLLAKRGIEVAEHQPRYEATAEDLGFRLIAWPDGWAKRQGSGPMGVEYKRLSGGKRQWEAEWGDGPPLRHIAQCEAQILASGTSAYPLTAVLLVPLIIERHSVTTEPVLIEPDAGRRTAIIEACRDFWAILVGGGLPEPDVSASSYRALVATTRLARKRIVVDDMQTLELVKAWQTAKAWSKAGEATEAAAKQTMAMLMGDADELELRDGTVVSRKLVQRKGFTVEPSESWRWSVKEPR